MKKIFFLFCLFAIMAMNDKLTGQSASLIPASTFWELSNPELGGTGNEASVSGNLLAADESGGSNTHIRDYSGYDGSQRSQITGGAWPANQTSPLDDVYIQFAVSPQPYSKFYFDSLIMEITATSINTMKAEIFYSTDPSFASPDSLGISTGYVVRDSWTKVQAKPGMTVEDGETLYVRIHFWVEDTTVKTGKYFCIKNIRVKGEGESLPAPASVKWFENGLPSAVISGNLLSNDPTFSDSLTLYNTTTDLPLNGGNNVTAGAIHTVSKIWNAEADTVSYLYFGFAVSPKTGGTFHIDSVIINIGGWFESNFKAAIYYSLKSDFSDATLLFSDTPLPGNALSTWKTAIDTIVYTDETFYLRVYPHNTVSAGWAKLIAVNDVLIKGSTTGLAADPPTVTTGNLSYLSTTFVTCGGAIPNDGGSPVTVRGVVWDTLAAPTVEDDLKTTDGSGSGSFVSHVTGLTPGKYYYLRAYATNLAGTSYGEEKTFTALASVLVPTVTTTSVSSVLVKTAETGGNITSWGGDTVTARGICWNTTGSPEITNNFTVDGEGLGTFKSIAYPLAENTKYYLRAYATNSAGTGYGEVIEFTTQTAAPDVMKVVAKDGSGDYITVQAAFDAVPDLYTGTWTIYIKPGVYKEKLMLGKNKVNVALRGDHPDSTILTYDDNANSPNGSGGTVGTSGSYSVSIEPNDFAAYKITFQNTNQIVQAVALRTNGDRQSYYHCRLKGYQDTYYTYGLGRIYMKSCYIEGAVDYIFGQATVVFDSCEFKIIRNGAPLTAASTNVNSKFGYVFRNCKIMTDKTGYDGNTISSVYLGRPWQGNPKVVFMYCEEPATLAPAGWTNMSAGLNPLFAEYKCFGPGYKPEQRSTNVNYPGIQLTDEQAAAYTIANIFAKTTNPAFGIDWMPDTTVCEKLSQTIEFGELPHKRMGEAPFELTGTSTSNLSIVYNSSNTFVATINGSTVTLVGAGITDITASQPGNFLYHAAPFNITQTLIVGEPSSLDDASLREFEVFPNPTTGRIFIKHPTRSATLLEIYNDKGQRLVETIMKTVETSIDVSSFPAGLYIVKINESVHKVVIKK